MLLLLLPLTKKARRTERRHPETWALGDARYRGPVELATEYGKVYGVQTDLNQSIDAAAGVCTRDPLVRYASRFFSTPAATLTKLDPALLRYYYY